MHIKKSEKVVQNFYFMISINKLSIHVWKADVLKGFCILPMTILLWSWAALLAGRGTGLSSAWLYKLAVKLSLYNQLLEDEEKHWETVLLFTLSWFMKGSLAICSCPRVQKSCQAFPLRNSWGCAAKRWILWRGVPALLSHSCWHPVASQHNCTASSAATELWKSQQHFKEFQLISLASTSFSFLIAF